MNRPRSFPAISRVLLATFFIVAGAMHFIRAEAYLPMMPPFLPAPMALIYLSGLLEIFFGALVLLPSTRRLGGWGLIAVLIGVFPANLYIALHPGVFPAVPAWALWARLPFQALFIYWVWTAALREPPR